MESVKIITHISGTQDFGIAITTRKGGFSRYPFDSFNLGLHVNDHHTSVMQNREKLTKRLGLASNHVIYMNQIHGSDVKIIDHIPEDVPTCDAMITNQHQVALAVLTADCVPLLFIDNQQYAIGAAHAGWRGTVAGIATKTIEAMQLNYGSKPQNIKVYIGPGIRECCYDVGSEVITEIKSKIPNCQNVIYTNNDKCMVNLQQANINLLIEAGVLAENISTATDCVCCMNDQYFSYRADNGQTGRLASLVWIK
jgi:YfiH family protein